MTAISPWRSMLIDCVLLGFGIFGLIAGEIGIRFDSPNYHDSPPNQVGTDRLTRNRHEKAASRFLACYPAGTKGDKEGRNVAGVAAWRGYDSIDAQVRRRVTYPSSLPWSLGRTS